MTSSEPEAASARLPPALASRARASSLGAARGERSEPVFALAPGGKEALGGDVRLGVRQRLALRALAAGAVSARDLLEAGASIEAARALARRGLVTMGRRALRRIPMEFTLADADRAREAPAPPAQAAARAP